MALATLYSQIVTTLSAMPGHDYSEVDAVHESVLNVAAAKLDIVGRQFPRLHEYMDLVERLRDIGRDIRRNSDLGRSPVDIGEVKACLDKIGPLHVKCIGLAIIYIYRRWLDIMII
jgi:hypothetical protein